MYKIFQDAIEKAGFSFVELQLADQNYLHYKAVDPSGKPCEVLCDIHDGWIMDRATGTKFFDMLTKVVI
jgi:hypothetical protein